MYVFQTNNTKLVAEIIKHPDIYPLISDDLSPPLEDFVLPTVGINYLLAKTVDGVIGCVVFQQISSVVCEIHIQVLPRFRKKYAMQFGARAVAWIFENTHFIKIVSKIPVIYPNVVAFAEQVGFEKEGLCKSSYVKNGLIIDQVYVGLSRG